MSENKSAEETAVLSNFIRQIITRDNQTGKYDRRVMTRFPPEPNGYLHIGHAKSICLNFGIAEEFEGGLYNLRFDDTNPTKEEQEFVDAIQEDIRWLGFDWGDRLYFASDYFEQLYEFAEQLISASLAYVDDLSADEIRAYRGTLTEPGRNSPYRERAIEENLDLFRRMRAGEFPDGTRVLRAKIDMASPNISLRDPVLYRILHATHHRTGDDWSIYPMYDWAHGLSDAIEGVTHSLCTLEFENNRPLYDWILDELDVYHHPQQIEFARLNLTHTVVSKRYLRALVEEGWVSGWDDPRMPTLRAMRRRGYPPEAIRTFCERVGVARSNSLIELSVLENEVRNDLNQRVPRAMVVVRPLRLIIDNYPADQVEHFDVPNYPQDKSRDEMRQVPFSREIFIEQEDFMEDAPRKFFRLSVGREVRLVGAYYVTCVSVEKDAAGEVVALHCTYDPETQGGQSPDGRKVKGTIHWVSVEHSLPAELRLYDTLFTKEKPLPLAEGASLFDDINPNSLEVLTNCHVEPSLADAPIGSRYQFMRQGYFVVDSDSKPGQLVFNRTVSLRDTWAKKRP